MPTALLDASALPKAHKKPYPYIVIKDALSEELCNRLIAEYPSYETMGVDAAKSNCRWDYAAHEVKDDPAISEAWKAAIAYFSSPDFFHTCVDIFGDSMVELYPKRFPSKAHLKSLRVGLRGADSYKNHDVLLDALISGNTPVTKPSSVRTNHIDRRNKLISGLLYLREDGDDSVGGDLQIRQFKPGYTRWQKGRCYDGVYVGNHATEVVETVKYEKNVLVLFVNSPVSFHGVTVRQPTPHKRLFINLVCEVKKPLFRIPWLYWRRVLRFFGFAKKKRCKSMSTQGHV